MNDVTDFETWAVANWTKVRDQINITNDNQEVDPDRLNFVLASFAGNFSWMIVIAEKESNELDRLELEFKQWYDRAYVGCRSLIKQEEGSSSSPTVKMIECRISVEYAEEFEQYRKRIIDQKSRVNLLKSFVRVFEKQANILQTLSSNLRSEAYYSGGIPIRTEQQFQENTSRTKDYLKKILNKEG